MQAGERDQPVYLEQPTTTNVGGESTTTWTDASGNSPPTPDWAKIISQRGTEAFEAARKNAQETIRLCVNYRDDVTTTWRIKWNNQYYYVWAVDRSEKHDGNLWLTAEIRGKE